MEQLLERILGAINDPGLHRILLPFKIVFGGIGIFFLMMIFFLLAKSSYLRMTTLDLVDLTAAKSFGLRKAGKRWKEIMAKITTGSEAEYKLAILEADSILADTLKRMNIPGETLEDRLRYITPIYIQNREDILRVHEIRNSIVHDPDYRITLEETRKALDTYESTFRELDVIQ